MKATHKALGLTAIGALLVLAVALPAAGSSGSASRHAPAIPSNGLIGHWPLDGNANDTSGHGHNGTIVGATSIAGVQGGAYHFNGSAYIDVGDLLFPSGTLSVYVWVKSQTQSVANNFRSAISKLDNTNGGPFEIFDGFTSTPSYTGPAATSWNGGVTNFIAQQKKLDLRDGHWHMVALTYTNGRQILYVDGAAMASTSFSGTLPVNTDGVRIGGYDFGPFHHPWTGDIDEVAIYSRVLTKVEILKIYQEIVPLPS
jgi:hypothetical protein